MFKFSLTSCSITRTTVVIVGFLIAIPPATAQQHAHTHGRMTLDVAVDVQSIALAIESPLESFLGFERAPRTDAEHKRVADMVAHLNAADQLFQPDPAAACKLSKVELTSSTLSLGTKEEEVYRHSHGNDEEKRHDHADDEHANVNVDIVFTCARATEARFIDVRLFDTYPRVRTIDVQVAAPQGQFKRVLQPDTSRLSLMN